MFKVGDKVRLTQDWARAIAGMEGEVVFPETESNIPLIRFPGWAYGHDGRLQIGSRSPLPEGSTEGLFTPGEYLELIEQEKPVVYEVGGTLTDANGVVRRVEDVLPDGRVSVLTNEKHIVCVPPDHYKYTPPAKLVPMTRDLMEKLDELAEYRADINRAQFVEDVCSAWQKAKESAK